MTFYSMSKRLDRIIVNHKPIMYSAASTKPRKITESPISNKNMQSVVRNLLKNESTILLFLYKDLKPFIDIIEELQSGQIATK